MPAGRPKDPNVILDALRESLKLRQVAAVLQQHSDLITNQEEDYDKYYFSWLVGPFEAALSYLSVGLDFLQYILPLSYLLSDNKIFYNNTNNLKGNYL